jgi:hypothetical protein
MLSRARGTEQPRTPHLAGLLHRWKALPGIIKEVSMRPAVAVLALAVTAAPVAAQQPASAIHRGGGLPAGWNVVLDNAEHQIADVSFMQMGTGFHAALGTPSAIVWNEANETGDTYTVTATFTDSAVASVSDGYGIMFGGEDLGESEGEYFAFVIRPDGQFTITQMLNQQMNTIQEWTAHEAIRQADETGRMANTVSVQVDDANVVFSVNGTEVASLPRAQFDDGDLDGLAGLRITSGHDVMIDGFQVTAGS